MRRLALALALLATACDGGGTAAPVPSPAPVTASVTPSAAPDPEGLRLRKAAARALRGCPCGFFLRLTDQESGEEIELYGSYDAKARRAVFGSEDETTYVEVDDGVTYYRGPETKRQWVRLDFSRVPHDVARTTRLSMLAAADPALMFAMAAGTSFPNEGSKGRYSISIDAAAALEATGAERDLLRRLVGDIGAYAAIWLGPKGMEAFHYDVLGAGRTDEHTVEVYFDLLHDVDADVPSVFAPHGVRVVKVR